MTLLDQALDKLISQPSSFGKFSIDFWNFKTKKSKKENILEKRQALWI